MYSFNEVSRILHLSPAALQHKIVVGEIQAHLPTTSPDTWQVSPYALNQYTNKMIANAKKLRGTNVALETRDTAREQERDAGDWEAGIERAKHVDALVRERHGVIRK